jgi:hypothetical protein
VFFLVLRAYVALLRVEFPLARGNFAAIHDSVRRHSCRHTNRSEDLAQTVCSAVDLACVWYWKQVLCLQRSAVTVHLLRDRGVPAQLVIGAQQMPFKAHAWVEVDGLVVNDRTYTNEIYAVLDRC